MSGVELIVIGPVGFTDQGLLNTVLGDISGQMHDVGGVTSYVTTGQPKGIDEYVRIYGAGRDKHVFMFPAGAGAEAQRVRNESLFAAHSDALVVVFPGAEKSPRAALAQRRGRAGVCVVLTGLWPTVSPPHYELRDL